MFFLHHPDLQILEYCLMCITRFKVRQKTVIYAVDLDSLSMSCKTTLQRHRYFYVKCLSKFVVNKLFLYYCN